MFDCGSTSCFLRTGNWTDQSGFSTEGTLQDRYVFCCNRLGYRWGGCGGLHTLLLWLNGFFPQHLFLFIGALE